MPTRTITTISRRFSRELVDTLMSLFALELVSPGSELYLASAWVTDVPLMDNHFGQYRSLMPETGGTEIRLSTLLNALSDRGVKVYVALQDDAINKEFANRLRRPPITLIFDNKFHAKMLVTENFRWDGSMNFTNNGLHKNPESISLTTDGDKIAQALLDMKRLFGDTHK